MHATTIVWTGPALRAAIEAAEGKARQATGQGRFTVAALWKSHAAGLRMRLEDLRTEQGTR
jgi:hypothetical protein